MDGMVFGDMPWVLEESRSHSGLRADIESQITPAGRSLQRLYALGIDSFKIIAALNTLRRYERARKGANIAMLGAMDAFKRLFSNDIVPLRLLRNTGLDLVDDHEDAVLICQVPYGLHELAACRVVAAFALEGFEEECCDLVRHHFMLEHEAQFVEGVRVRVFLRHTPPVWMGEGGDEHGRQDGVVATPILRS